MDPIDASSWLSRRPPFEKWDSVSERCNPATPSQKVLACLVLCALLSCKRNLSCRDSECRSGGRALVFGL